MQSSVWAGFGTSVPQLQYDATLCTANRPNPSTRRWLRVSPGIGVQCTLDFSINRAASSRYPCGAVQDTDDATLPAEFLAVPAGIVRFQPSRGRWFATVFFWRRPCWRFWQHAKLCRQDWSFPALFVGVSVRGLAEHDFCE